MLLNESFLDEKDYIYIEAKIEAIQEAVSVAIIAAIVSMIGAIILFLTKFIGMMQKGASETVQKVEDAVKKMESDNSDHDSSPDSKLKDFEKDLDRMHKEATKRKYDRLCNETISQLSKALNSGSNFNGERKYISIFANYAEEKMSNIKLTEDIGPNISTIHMSDFFNTKIFIEMDRCLETISRKYSDALRNTKNWEDSSSEVSDINKSIDELVKLKLFTDNSLNQNVFNYDIISDDTDNNYQKIKDMRKYYIVNKFKNKSSFFDLNTNIANCKDMKEVSKEAIKKITEMNNGARKLQQDMKKYQSVVNNGEDYQKREIYRVQKNNERIKTGFSTLNSFYEIARNQISYYQKAIHIWQTLEKSRLQQCSYLAVLINQANPCIKEAIYLTMLSDKNNDMELIDEPAPDYRKYYK